MSIAVLLGHHNLLTQSSQSRTTMATNILSVPFRRTRSVSLGDGLKEFISTALDQHPEQFRDDFAAIDKLRADIAILDVHTSSLERLLRYHAHLLALSTKLPVDVSLP